MRGDVRSKIDAGGVINPGRVGRPEGRLGGRHGCGKSPVLHSDVQPGFFFASFVGNRKHINVKLE